MRKTQLLEKWKKDLSILETRKKKLIQNRQSDLTYEIQTVDNDIEMLEDIIWDLEYEVLNDSNIVYQNKKELIFK